MKNPVQQMLKAGSQMKNNPQLAKQEANSPDKVKAFAAQMVIPRQQAMQNSKPIPYPVGSVLMQKLAQAQQAALAAQQPNPREGGIAQMAAKGGVLKFASAGKVKAPRKKKTATNNTTTASEDFLKKFGVSPAAEETASPDAEFNRAIAESKRRQALKMDEDLKAQNKIQESNTRAPKAKINQEVEKLRGIASSAKAPASTALQTKRDLLADKARRTALTTSKADNALLTSELLPSEYRPFLTQEELPTSIATRMSEGLAKVQDTRKAKNVYEQTKADIARNREIANEEQLRKTRKESAANALKTQEGRITPEQLREREKQNIRDKSSIIGERGNVVPRQPATPDQKARRTRVSKDLNLPEKTGIASAASKEAKAYMESLQPATPAEPAAETQMPSKKKATDISREEADTRLASAAAEGKSRKNVQSPVTVMSDINDTAHNIIMSNPEWAEKLSKAAADFNANNPNATPSERGAYLKSIAPPEALDHLMGQLSPTLEKHGLLFSKEGGIGRPMMEAIDEATPKATPQSAWNEPADFKRPAAGPSKFGDRVEGAVGTGAGALQAYSTLAPIANVALDPNKSKADVAREAKYQAVQSNPSIGIGSAVGSGIGESIDKVNELLGRPKTNYGEAFSALGAYGGRGFSGLARDVSRGKGDESPNLTAKQTLPSVGSLVDTGAEKAKSLYGGIEKALMDDRTPADREREEQLQALLAQEEASRAVPANTPPAAQTPPGQSQAGAAPAGAGKGITGSPALRTPATATGDGASAPAGATPAATQTSVPEAKTTQDQYAGDTSEGTPEGAVAELMKLRGPGYQYSPEVMGELKDSIEEERARTALSMFANIGAGLANRDRYAGAHDAALLANQAFTSGGEREDQAKQQFLQGIIHNEQEPFERRKAAYEMYTKMQMAAAQNEALYGRALLSSDARRYAADQSRIGRSLGGSQQDPQYKSYSDDAKMYTQMAKLAMVEGKTEQADRFTQMALEARRKAGEEVGIAGDAGLGQNTPRPIDLKM